MTNPETKGVENALDIDRVSRVRDAGKWVGRKLATGLLVGGGFAIPAVVGGVVLLNRAEDNAKAVVKDMLDDAERRAQNTGNQWIFTFKSENTEILKNPLESIDSKLPDSTPLPTTTTMPQEQQAASPSIPESTTTTTTTVPPQE